MKDLTFIIYWVAQATAGITILINLFGIREWILTGKYLNKFSKPTWISLLFTVIMWFIWKMVCENDLYLLYLPN